MSKWIPPSDEEKKEMRMAEEQALQVKEENFGDRAQRLRMSAKITVRSQTNFFMGFSENISEGGVFLSTMSPPGVGEKIEVSIPLGDGDRQVVVEGIVRWHRQRADGSATGCGVQFLDISPEAKSALENLIRLLRKEPLFVDL